MAGSGNYGVEEYILDVDEFSTIWDADFGAGLQAVREGQLTYQTDQMYQAYPLPLMQNPYLNAARSTYHRYSQDATGSGIYYPTYTTTSALLNNSAASSLQFPGAGGVRESTQANGGYPNHINSPTSPTLQEYTGTYANQTIQRGSVDHNSSTRRSRSTAPQGTRSRLGGNETSGGSSASHNTSRGTQVQYGEYPAHVHTQHMPKGDSQWVAAQPTAPVGYTSGRQRLRGDIPSYSQYSQAATFQDLGASTATAFEHGNNQSLRREKDPYGEPSPMKHLLTRRAHVPPPSTLTTSSATSGETFSSISTNNQDGSTPGPDAPQLLNQLRQLHITDNAAGFGGNMQTMQPARSSYGVHAYANAQYGQVPASMTTQPLPQQASCSNCQTCMHIHSHPLPHYASHGDYPPHGEVRIGYCPIHGCNRGPGSRRPFPRTCNLLEHLRGVHRVDIPRGAKLRTWLVEQGYNPDLLVEFAKPRS